MSVKKKIISVGLAVVMLMNIGPTAAISKSDTRSGELDSHYVKGVSNITSTTGSSETSTSCNAAANVSSTYSYVNISTLATGKITKSNGYMYSASVSFKAPSGCRSVKIVGSHSVRYSSQNWSATTSVVY